MTSREGQFSAVLVYRALLTLFPQKTIQHIFGNSPKTKIK